MKKNLLLADKTNILISVYPRQDLFLKTPAVCGIFNCICMLIYFLPHVKLFQILAPCGYMFVKCLAKNSHAVRQVVEVFCFCRVNSRQN